MLLLLLLLLYGIHAPSRKYEQVVWRFSSPPTTISSGSVPN
jgi:hypothetical protein